jgi:hypothetical protein
MKIIKIIPTIIITTLLASVLVSPPASADSYCYSVGLFASCVEVPQYTTPTPPPPKPLPIWACSIIYTAQAITTVIPGGSIPTLISRVIFIPTVACAWEMR